MLLEELVRVAGPQDIGSKAADELEGILLRCLSEYALRQFGHVDALPLGTATKPLGGVGIQPRHQRGHGHDHRSRVAPLGPFAHTDLRAPGTTTKPASQQASRVLERLPQSFLHRACDGVDERLRHEPGLNHDAARVGAALECFEPRTVLASHATPDRRRDAADALDAEIVQALQERSDSGEESLVAVQRVTGNCARRDTRMVMVRELVALDSSG